MATERQRAEAQYVRFIACLARLHAKFATRLTRQSSHALRKKSDGLELEFALAWCSARCLLSRFSSGRASLPKAHPIHSRQILPPPSLHSISVSSFFARDWNASLSSLLSLPA